MARERGKRAVRGARRVALAAFVATGVVGAPGRGAAQEWPEGTLLLGVGINSVKGSVGLGLSAGVDRRWGPFVAGVVGELGMRWEGGGNPRPTLDVLNGNVYCGQRLVKDPSVPCPAGVGVVGGVGVEAGISFAPFVPLMVSRGYRLGPVEEPYWAATIHGTTGREGLSWTGRVAGGRAMWHLYAGVAIDVDVVRRP